METWKYNHRWQRLKPKHYEKRKVSKKLITGRPRRVDVEKSRVCIYKDCHSSYYYFVLEYFRQVLMETLQIQRNSRKYELKPKQNFSSKVYFISWYLAWYTNRKRRLETQLLTESQLLFGQILYLLSLSICEFKCLRNCSP